MLEGADRRLVGSPGLGCEQLAHLQDATVAVVGTGVLGGQASYHFGLLGVRQVLIDCGCVDVENLGNQGFPVAALGDPKSVVRARQLTALNPDCRVRALTARIEDLGLAALVGADLLFTGLDGAAARARVAAISTALSLPWIDTAVDGSGRWLRGTVSLYDPRAADSPCYLCPHDARSLDTIRREGSGAGCPSWRNHDAPITPPTLQASAMGAMVAAFAVQWATRVLLGAGKEFVGRQLVIDCDGVPRVRLIELRRNPCCVGNHASLQPLTPIPGTTLGHLLDAARGDLGGAPDELVLHGRTLVDGLVCGTCGARRDIVRVPEACSDDDVRCDCPRDGDMMPAAITSCLSLSDAQRLAYRSWTDLGVPTAEVITARAGEHAAHYVVHAVPHHSHWQPRSERNAT